MSIWLNFKILSLACVLVLTACSTNKIVQTYDGAVLPNKAISILTAPENIILLSVNGQAVPQYMLSNLEVNYGLKAGENLIVFQYESIWSKAKKDDETGSRVELIKSDPLAVVIPALAGKNYNFNWFICARSSLNQFLMSPQILSRYPVLLNIWNPLFKKVTK